MTTALIVALAGAAIGYTTDTMIALGGTPGGRMGWGVLGDRIVSAPTTSTGGLLGTAIDAAAGGLFAAVYVADPAPYAAFLGTFVAVCGILAAPIDGESLARRR